jgi:hypothetical protein
MSGAQITFDGEMSELKNQLNSMESYIHQWGDGISTIGVAAFGAWASTKAFDGLKTGLSDVLSMASEFIGMASEAAVVDAKLEAVIKATGGAAGLTADQMAGYAMQLRNITNVDDDVIKGAETILATFKEVKGDEFKRATAAAVDMAAVLGGDASSAAMQLGKALNDPEKGLTMLAKSGVSFTEKQTKLIESMVETGNVAGAQNAILAEMEAQFGGAAAAAAGAAGGGFAQLKFIIDDIKEGIGAKLLPVVDAFALSLKDHLSPVVGEILEQFGGWDMGTAGIDSFSSSVAELAKTMAQLAGSMKDQFLPVAQSLLSTIQAGLDMLPNSGRVNDSDRKFVHGLSDSQFKQGEKAFAEAERASTFIGQKNILGGVGLDVANGDDYRNLKAAFEERQNEMNRQVTKLHEATGAAGGEMEQFRRMIGAMNSFGAQGGLITDQTKKGTPTVKAGLAGGNEDVGMFSGMLGGVLGIDPSSMLAKGVADMAQMAADQSKEFEDRVLKMSEGLDDPKHKRKGEDDSHKASFESLGDLFKRIQVGAASTEKTPERQLTAQQEMLAEMRAQIQRDKEHSDLLQKIATNTGNPKPAVLF